mmetsp:Transcript_1630/g.7119  ORF Transcript_1630/g.7119 Transcript_1630/m.7119 type:complete len:235 (+) Transcript_1630:1875-2579(+)
MQLLAAEDADLGNAPRLERAHPDKVGLLRRLPNPQSVPKLQLLHFPDQVCHRVLCSVGTLQSTVHGHNFDDWLRMRERSRGAYPPRAHSVSQHGVCHLQDAPHLGARRRIRNDAGIGHLHNRTAGEPFNRRHAAGRGRRRVVDDCPRIQSSLRSHPCPFAMAHPDSQARRIGSDRAFASGAGTVRQHSCAKNLLRTACFALGRDVQGHHAVKVEEPPTGALVKLGRPTKLKLGS